MKRLIPLAALVLSACATVPAPSIPPITEPEIRATIAVLADDRMEGRMAGTPAEARTIAYIAERFRAAGLASGTRGPLPYLDPFQVVAKPAGKAIRFAPGPAGQAEFGAHMARLGSFTSHNVIGVARGRHPDGKAVLVMAHWDHLGLCAPAAADKICNGAVDNASGVAVLIAVAEKVARMHLDRDVWFVSTGAEEWGLRGSKAFADRPPLPLDHIVAAFNLDTVAVAPAGAKVAMIAPPNSPLTWLVRDSVKAMGRQFDDDHEADNFLRRQDGWALAEHGVPTAMVGGSFSDLGLLKRFLATRYHSPADELRPDTDLGGATEDAGLHLHMVRRAASRHFEMKPPRVPQLGS